MSGEDAKQIDIGNKYGTDRERDGQKRNKKEDKRILVRTSHITQQQTSGDSNKINILDGHEEWNSK